VANDSLEFVQRGKVSIVRRQYAEAVKICRLGLLGNPTLLEGRLVLGMALTALERWDEVLAEMRVALEIDTQSALAWLLKGEALVGKGDYAQAEASLKRAKELDPSNSKADQLLSEIQIARAAGFEGIPAEPTDTKVYPAKATEPDSATPITDPGILDAQSGDIALEYEDEATEVDPEPSDQVRLLMGAAPSVKQPDPNEPKKSKRAREPTPTTPTLPDDTDEDVDESSTETFLPVRGSVESSYESPAADDYAERARPAVQSLIDEPSDPGHVDTRTPIESRRPHRPGPLRPAAHGGKLAPESTDPSIELNSRDLVSVGSAERFDLSEDEDELTEQRHQRQVDENAGTRPEAPEPVVNRNRPLRPFEAQRAVDRSPSPRPQAMHPLSSPLVTPQPTWQSDAPTMESHNAGQSYSDNDRPPTTPGVVRVPIGRRSPPSVTAEMPNVWERLRHALGAERLPRGGLALIATAIVVVIAVGVVTGLLIREMRMRARVARRHELAKQKLASGNYPGFQAAELLYRQILTERDDPPARALRARVLAQMAFEFGDPPDAAARAVASLGEADELMPCKDARPGCEDAQAARVYLAMTRGELERAGRMAAALRRKLPDGQSSYLVGRAELLLERPETAVDALRAAAEREPRDPLVLHALGLAESQARRDDKALDAYRRALDSNSNHIATLVDRAILQVRRGAPADRDAARVALEGVVTKLVGDASSGQLARGFVGLAELELARGDLEAARRALDSAVAKRREGDTLLSEELAKDFARAFALDAAEREATRAMAGSSRLAPRLVLAEVQLRRGRPAQALAVIEEATTSRPEALVLRALANIQLGRREQARLDAEAALRVQPDLLVAKVALARVDIADGRLDKAQRDLDRLEQATHGADVAAALGALHAAKHAGDRARFWLHEALKRDPLLVDARVELARLYASDGKLDEARGELNQILQLNPAYAPARRQMAELALAQGDAAAARDQFDALADKDPDAPTLLGAARAHLVLGDLPGARERVEKARKLDASPPTVEESIDLLARADLQEHKTDDAIALLLKAAPAAARGETGALLIDAYLDREQPDKAVAARLMVPPRVRLSVDMLVARARMQVERGRDVAGEVLASEALNRLRGPTASRWLKAEALVVLGRSQWEQGIFRPAQRSLKTAADLDPFSARAFYYLALVDEDLQRPVEARQAMESAVKCDPRFPDALYNLGRLRTDAGDARAHEAFQQYLDVAPKGVYADDARRALNPEAVKPTNSPLRKKRRGR